MNPTFEKFLNLAEEQYLPCNEVENYRGYLASLEKKVEVYEIVRDQEVFLFQILADKLQEKYPDERHNMLCEAISQWSLVLKYCAMAMILDNSEYLSMRIDNWLRELIQLRSIPQLDKILYETLVEILPEVLLDEQIYLIQPYLDQVKVLSEVGATASQLLGIR